MTIRKYCKECELPLFKFRIKHNGRVKNIYKCVAIHGTLGPTGKVTKIKGRNSVVGADNYFRGLSNISAHKMLDGFSSEQCEFHPPDHRG